MVDDAFGAVAELAASQHGAFTRSQAALLGASGSLVGSWRRTGRVWVPTPGALAIAGTPPTWRTHLMGLTLADPRCVVSHRAAATLHGFDGAGWAIPEVTLPRGGRCRDRSAIAHTSTHLDAVDVTYVDGIRVTAVARPLADVGAVLGDEAVLALVDDAVRRGASEGWLRWTLDRVDRPGPSGTGTLARALAQRWVGEPDSVFERRLLTILDHPSLPVPEPHHRIVDDEGRTVAELDVAYVDARVGVEAHSAQHHRGLLPERHDVRRHNRLVGRGWTVLYVTWAQLDDPDAIRAAVRAALAIARPT